MFHIVSKLEADPSRKTLWTTDDVKVSVDPLEAVNRIGAWKGDLFAVWELPEGAQRPGPRDAAQYIAVKAPTSVYVSGEGDALYPLHEDVRETVTPGWGRDGKSAR